MSNNMPYGTLRDIASELKMIRKVLERMVQAPIFNKAEAVYICYNNDCDDRIYFSHYENCIKVDCKNRKRSEQ